MDLPLAVALFAYLGVLSACLSDWRLTLALLAPLLFDWLVFALALLVAALLIFLPPLLAARYGRG